MYVALSEKRIGLQCAVESLNDPSNGGHVTILLLSHLRLPRIWRVSSLNLYPPGAEWSTHTPRHWFGFLSPHTTRGDTMELLEPASTQVSHLRLRFNYGRRSVGQSILVSHPVWGA
jgi:hypothetical protein